MTQFKPWNNDKASLHT